MLQQIELDLYGDAVDQLFQRLLPRLRYWRDFWKDYAGYPNSDPIWWDCRISHDDHIPTTDLFGQMFDRYKDRIIY